MECCQAKVDPEQEDEKNEDNVETADESILKLERTPTDVVFLVLFGLFLLVLSVLLGYCMYFGDIYRILNGYDNCGNVCGRMNVFNDVNNTGCHGMDMTKYKYLRTQSWGFDTIESDTRINRDCVEQCNNNSGFRDVLNRCMPESTAKQTESYLSKTGLKDFFQEVAEDLLNSWKDILYMCCIAFVFSVITLVMFKYLAGLIVWIVLSGVIVASIALTTLLWIHYKVELRDNPNDAIGQRRVNMFLGCAIVSTFLTILFIAMIVFLRKRIKLVIILFKEAGKAAASMPLLLVEPILTFISLAIVVTLWFYFTLWIESSGRLSIDTNVRAIYVKDDAMKVTRWYNLMALFWTTQFIFGCQHIVIAGAVATWYFTRSKNNLDSPIMTSFRNLYRYHMGTVALGSLLLAIIQMLRQLLSSKQCKSNSEEDQCASTSCGCCLGSCQSWIQYINRNAYIETAIYGEPFFTAGSKAFHKLMSNTLRVFTINTIGDFVLFLGKVFVVVITVLSGMELLRPKSDLHHMWVPLTIAGIFAYFISHCFITVYEMIIDTIFLCFCEDCEMNDGLNRPYYMSTSLMDFVTNSKKELGISDQS